MAEARDDNEQVSMHDAGPTGGDWVTGPTVYTVKPSLAQKAFAYTTIGCIMSVLVCCTIWLCAWILQALPAAR
jgi:hypothetical protein